MNLRTKVLTGLSWQIISVTSISTIHLIVLMVLGRYLEPREFGIVALCNIAVGFAQLFSDVGVGPAIIQQRDLSATQIQGSFYFSMVLGILFTIILICCAGFVENYFHTAGIKKVMIWLSLSFTFSGMGVVSQSLLLREMRFKQLMIFEVLSAMFSAMISIPMAIYGFGVWALVVSLLLLTLCRSVSMITYVRHPMLPEFYFREMKGLLNYGGGLTFSRFFNYIASQGDKFIAAKVLGPVTLGYYERAFKIMEVPLSMMGNALDRVLFPAMSTIQDETGRLKRNFFKAIAIGYCFQVPICILMIVLAPELVAFILGSGWDQTVLPLQILLSTSPLRLMVRMSDSLVRAKGAVYNSAVRKAIYAFVVMVGSWVGHFWGLSGIAIGITVSILINYVLMSNLAHCLLNTNYKEHLSSILPSATIGLITALLSIPLAYCFRHMGVHPYVVLFITGFMTCSILLILVMSVPRLFGLYIEGIVKNLMRYLSLGRK